MPKYNWIAPDGSVHIVDGSGSSSEQLQLRHQWELKVSGGEGQPYGRTTTPKYEVMRPAEERDVLAQTSAETGRQIQGKESALESLRQEFAGGISGAGALAGGTTAAARVGRVLAPLGPEIALPAAAVAFAGGAALGAGGGQYVGGKVFGTMENEPEQAKRALESAENEAMINLGFTGAGTALRGAKAVASPYVRQAVDTMFSLQTPETLERIANMRSIGLRATVADINPRLAKVYGSLFSPVPVISNPLRAAATRRQGEIRNVVDSLTGPLESGLNEVAISKNFLVQAERAHMVRKDWYDRIYGEARNYFSQHPEIRINNGAIDAGEKYVFDMAKGATPSTVPGTVTKQVAGQKVEQATAERVLTGDFTGPSDVDWFLRYLSGTPAQLDYFQLERMQKNLRVAFDKATPDQSRYLAQAKEGLDVALEQVNDPAAKTLVTRGRNVYRQVMEFFQNPQAKKFEAVEPGIFPNVKEITRNKNTPTAMSDELFTALTKDITPQGVRNLTKMVRGPAAMKPAADRYIGAAVKQNEKFVDGKQTINWRGIQQELGLDIPGSARQLGTEELLRVANHPLQGGKLRTVLETAEKEIGPNIPPLAIMYARSAALSGPGAGIRAMLATKALHVLGGPIQSAIAVMGFRKFSQFLSDPKRLELMATVLKPSGRPPNVVDAASRQIIRYLATDLANEEHEGSATQSMILDTENRIVETINAYQTEGAMGAIRSLPRIQDKLGVQP